MDAELIRFNFNITLQTPIDFDEYYIIVAQMENNIMHFIIKFIILFLFSFYQSCKGVNNNDLDKWFSLLYIASQQSKIDYFSYTNNL